MKPAIVLAVVMAAADVITKFTITANTLEHDRGNTWLSACFFALAANVWAWRNGPAMRGVLVIAMAGAISNMSWAFAGGIPDPFVLIVGSNFVSFNVADVMLATAFFMALWHAVTIQRRIGQRRTP